MRKVTNVTECSVCHEVLFYDACIYLGEEQGYVCQNCCNAIETKIQDEKEYEWMMNSIQ